MTKEEKVRKAFDVAREKYQKAYEDRASLPSLLMEDRAGIEHHGGFAHDRAFNCILHRAVCDLERENLECKRENEELKIKLASALDLLLLKPSRKR